MKQHIVNVNLNISKDTPPEMLTELYAVLKPLQMQSEKERTAKPLYALNEDIEKLHGRYEELFKQVRNSLNLSEKQIELEEETLSRKYKFELEELSKERKLNYDERQAKIEARADEETPFRRGWWWRLLFRPLTNRAQDIIEARAALEADIRLSAEERIIDDQRNAHEQFKESAKQADNADVCEAFEEPQNTGTPETEQKQSNGQLQGQLRIDDVQPVQTVPTRRPRPPRSCRRA